MLVWGLLALLVIGIVLASCTNDSDHANADPDLVDMLITRAALVEEDERRRLDEEFFRRLHSDDENNKGGW